MENFYQQLSCVPNTIISLEYNEDEFLSFRVNTASQGKIVYEGYQGIGLQCLINGKRYTLNKEHFRQLSERECHELLNYLGIEARQLLQD